MIGSGFGGSVSALRLAEKGYSVAVLECGRRYRDEDFAKSTWNLRRYYWMPRIGLRGATFHPRRLRGRRWMAERTGGVAQSGITEAVFKQEERAVVAG